MKHWKIEDMDWDRFDPAKVDPKIIPLVKAAAMVERNAADYTQYLCSVFHEDPDFCRAAGYWSIEETQHGDALGKWAMLADPSWDFMEAFQRYREGYQVDTSANTSIRGSLTGELIARCMVETGTSSYYTALAESTDEPVLKAICKQIAADEYRHFKLFYDHMRRYLAREKLWFWQRLRIALGRVGESEDDELAFAYHCGNLDPAEKFNHGQCTAAYLIGATGVYRPHHIARAVAMLFKVVGLNPHGRLSNWASKLSYAMVQRRRRKMLGQYPALAELAR